MNNAKAIKMAQCASPAGMRRKDRVYQGVGGALLLPLFCWQCMCVVCMGGEGEIEVLAACAYYFTS